MATLKSNVAGLGLTIMTIKVGYCKPQNRPAPRERNEVRKGIPDLESGVLYLNSRNAVHCH